MLHLTNIFQSSVIPTLPLHVATVLRVYVVLRMYMLFARFKLQTTGRHTACFHSVLLRTCLRARQTVHRCRLLEARDSDIQGATDVG